MQQFQGLHLVAAQGFDTAGGDTLTPEVGDGLDIPLVGPGQHHPAEAGKGMAPGFLHQGGQGGEQSLSLGEQDVMPGLGQNEPYPPGLHGGFQFRIGQSFQGEMPAQTGGIEVIDQGAPTGIGLRLGPEGQHAEHDGFRVLPVRRRIPAPGGKRTQEHGDGGRQGKQPTPRPAGKFRTDWHQSSPSASRVAYPGGVRESHEGIP